jgi:hypothetical protein
VAGVVVVTGGVTQPAVSATSTLTVPVGWSYVGVSLWWTSTTSITVRFRAGGATETQTITTTVCDSTYQNLATSTAQIVSTAAAQDMQIASTPSGSPDWLDTFVPNSVIEAGLNELAATPPIEANTDAWSVLQAIAQAEAACVLIDERGLFQFWPRSHWGTAPAATQVQRTIRSSVPLESVSVLRAAARIRNIVRVPVTPITVTQPGIIWQLSGAARDLKVNARATRRWTAGVAPAQAYQVDTRTHVIPSGGATTDMRSGYRAARGKAGGASVTNLTMTVTATSDSITIAVTNPNRYPVWLVTPSTGFPADSIGKPSMTLIGRLVTTQTTDPDTAASVTQTGYVVENRWQPSIDVYGSRPLTLSPSVWLQLGEPAEALGLAILHDTAWPCPQLESVTIVADPALMLGDRAQLVDDTGRSGIDDPYLIVGKVDKQPRSGEATQDLILKPVGPPGAWLLGVEGRSEAGVSTRL